MGVHRFRVDRVLHRALDGLILTCEVTNFYEEGSDIDVKLASSELFTQMKNNAIEFCRISQQAVTSSRAKIFQHKEDQVKEIQSAS